jgi:hypothetical protein
MHKQTKTLDDKAKSYQRKTGTGPSEQSSFSRDKYSRVIQIRHSSSKRLTIE